MIICLQDVRFELRHISARKWMHESDHLIKKTAQRPYIAFERIGSLFPYLRTCVVRCPYFGTGHPVFTDGADVHVTDFYAVANDKKICCFYIAVKNVGAMETAESVCHFPCKSAKLLLGKGSFCLTALHHQLQEISALCEFSDETKVFSFEEGLPVLDDIGMCESREEPNLIETIHFLLLGEAAHLHFLYRVYLAVYFSSRLIDY